MFFFCIINVVVNCFEKILLQKIQRFSVKKN